MHLQEKQKNLENSKKELKLVFSKEMATLLLDVGLDQKSFSWLKDRALKENFFKKTEFHITIIGRETGEIILAKLSNSTPEKGRQLLKRIGQLSSRFTWDFSQEPEYYYISKKYSNPEDPSAKEERRSYIKIIGLPDLAQFYKELNSMLDLNLEVPFPHITLFTTSTLEKNKLRGIGIYSKSQFQNLNLQKLNPDQGG